MTVSSSLIFHSPHMLRPLTTLCRTADIPRGDGVWAATLPWTNFSLLSKICLLLQETKISFTSLLWKPAPGEGMMGIDMI